MAGGARFALEAIVDICSVARKRRVSEPTAGAVFHPWRWRQRPLRRARRSDGIAAPLCLSANYWLPFERYSDSSCSGLANLQSAPMVIRLADKRWRPDGSSCHG